MSDLLKAVETIRRKLLFRMDAEEENENANANKPAKKSTALGVRLPYGIAKDLGINTEGLSPREVWDKIKGKGIDPKSAMSEKIASPDKKVDVSKTTKKSLPKMTMDNCPSWMRGTSASKKETSAFCDKVNSAVGTDSEVGELYRGLGKLNDQCVSSAIKNAKRKTIPYGKGNLSVSYKKSTGELTECVLNIPKVIDDDTTRTVAHELGHYLDAMCGDGTVGGYMSTTSNSALRNAILNEKIEGKNDISQESWAAISNVDKRANAARQAETVKVSQELSACNHKYLSGGGFSSYDEYNKEYKRIKREGKKRIESVQNNELDGYDNLMDMYDAMSGGNLMSYGEVSHGHGKAYYYSPQDRAHELFANYCALSLFKPELLKYFEKDFPETSKQLKAHVGNILKRIGG